MSLIQAICPGCRTVLTIPSEWIDQPLRCKGCGLITQGSPAPPTPPAFAVSPPSKAAASEGQRQTMAFLCAWLLGMLVLAGVLSWTQANPIVLPRQGGRFVEALPRKGDPTLPGPLSPRDPPLEARRHPPRRPRPSIRRPSPRLLRRRRPLRVRRKAACRPTSKASWS